MKRESIYDSHPSHLQRIAHGLDLHWRVTNGNTALDLLAIHHHGSEMDAPELLFAGSTLTSPLYDARYRFCAR